jgi:ATP-dependent helicase HepA
VWLAQFLQQHQKDKILLICEDIQVVKSLSHVLPDIVGEEGFVLFHEDLSIIARDKAAAWFARPDGAMLLVSSEIGSEGRNFQFSNNLILFDLPLDAALVEQRIGRLDRIGQNKEIHIHVPYVTGSAQEVMFHWYNEGLDAFGAPLMSGGELFLKYTDDLIEALDDPAGNLDSFVKNVIPLVKEDSAVLRRNIEKGRDRLLEFNSRDPEAAKEITDEIQKMDSDTRLKDLIFETLLAAGLEIEKSPIPKSFVFTTGPQVEAGTIPGMPDSGMIAKQEGEEEREVRGSALTATFDRNEAMAHEEIDFLTWEHPLAQGVIDMSTAVGKGTESCVFWENSGSKGLVMQFNFMIEPSIAPEWGLSDVAGPKMIRVLIDGNGKDCSERLAELDKALLRDTKVPQNSPPVTAKLKFFATTGLAEAKRSAMVFMKDYSEKAADGVEVRSEQEYQRLNHLLALRGKAENSPVLALLRKNILERKKAALTPQLRLDAVRLLVCR